MIFLISYQQIKPFQFTPLREGRHVAHQLPPQLHRDFNSRPCVRGDAKRRPSLIYTIEFQFTPLREGRRDLPPTAGASTVFQFTPQREGRQRRCWRCCSA